MTWPQAVAIFEQVGGANWAYLAWLGALTVACTVLVAALILVAIGWRR